MKTDSVNDLDHWFEHRGARPVFVPFEVVSEHP